MEENKDRSLFWNIAGTAGLALGLTSTVFMFIGQLLSDITMPAIVSSLLSFVLWAGKFAGCIWLMMYFMRKYAQGNQKCTNSDTFKLGMTAAFLSALIFAAANFANIAFISTESFNEQFSTMLQQMAPMMDSNSTAMMEKMMENMPQISFFSNLFYCFIYGTLLSTILSRNIPSKDPFAEYKQD